MEASSFRYRKESIFMAICPPSHSDLSSDKAIASQAGLKFRNPEFKPCFLSAVASQAGLEFRNSGFRPCFLSAIASQTGLEFRNSGFRPNVFRKMWWILPDMIMKLSFGFQIQIGVLAECLIENYGS